MSCNNNNNGTGFNIIKTNYSGTYPFPIFNFNNDDYVYNGIKCPLKFNPKILTFNIEMSGTVNYFGDSPNNSAFKELMLKIRMFSGTKKFSQEFEFIMDPVNANNTGQFKSITVDRKDSLIIKYGNDPGKISFAFTNANIVGNFKIDTDFLLNDYYQIHMEVINNIDINTIINNRTWQGLSMRIDFIRNAVSKNNTDGSMGNFLRSDEGSMIFLPSEPLLKFRSSNFIPQILIYSQTFIDGSDIGSTIFQILDEYYYYKDKPLLSECSKDPSMDLNRTSLGDQIKITNFDKCSVKIVSVLKGIGVTANDKIRYIWNNNNEISLPSFTQNIMIYSVVRYLLSKILYGKFNINYLLQKYYKKFIKDLGNSRFCKFVSFFTEGDLVGYDNYFL